MDARNDIWVGEQDYEAIHKQLDETASRVKKGEPTFGRLDELAARFRKLSVVQLKIVAADARMRTTRAPPFGYGWRSPVRPKMESASHSRVTGTPFGERLAMHGGSNPLPRPDSRRFAAVPSCSPM